MLVAGSGTRKPYGWLSGFGMRRDATASVSDWGDDPEPIVAAMRAAIDDAEITVDAIDAIHASANGSIRGDAIEERAIAQLFGERIPPVIATKGIFGEYAAGGALQLVAALLAVDGQVLHATPGFERGTLPVVREKRAAELRHVLVNSVSAGGGVVCAVVSQEGAE